jgi:hypothetical protein
MKQYIGVKVITAKPMTKDIAESEAHLGRSVGGEHSGEAEGYLVEYEGGYQAWSPKDVFEEAYYPTQDDDFEFEIDRDAIREDYQHRVIDEFDSLFEKTQALAKFILTETFDTTIQQEQDRLQKQLKAMVTYRDVLYNRIINF